MSQLGSMGFLTYGYPYDYWKYEAEDMHKGTDENNTRGDLEEWWGDE